jgi:hypothetical protein
VKEEAEGVQRRLYNDGFHNLSTPIIMLIKMKENEMGRACSMHGSLRNYVNIFNLNSEWRRLVMHTCAGFTWCSIKYGGRQL